MTIELTDEQVQALQWARTQNFSSVSARNAKLCAQAYDALKQHTTVLYTQEEVEAAMSAAIKVHEAKKERQHG